MERLKFCAKNVLAIGTTTASGSDANNPTVRLYDRDRNDKWKWSTTGAVTFQTILSSAESVDFLAVDNHNFIGETITWEYYDGSWHDVISSWVQSDNDRIVKLASSAVSGTRFRVTVTSTTNPECAEITMSLRSLSLDPQMPGPVGGRMSNVDTSYSKNGYRHSVKFGEKKWLCDYVFKISQSTLDDFKTVLDYIEDGFYPFYVYDHDGTLRYVELMMPIKWPHEYKGSTSIPPYYLLKLQLQEVF